MRTSLNPPWFEYKAERFVWTQQADVGIILGYQFNKNRTCIETGVRQARAESGWELSFSEYTPSSNGGGTFSNSHLTFQDGIKGIKIPVLLSTQIVYWDSLKLNKARSFSLHCSFIVGVNIQHQRYRGQYPGIDKTARVSQTALMYLRSTTYSEYAPHTILPETGFSLELRKRQKEWASLTLYYLISVGRHGSFGQVQAINIDIHDTSTNQTISYDYGLSSRGNGLLVEISKKIFFSKRKKEPKFIKD